jgi:hypothetical protein
MNKISKKYADYFTVCSSSITDSDMDCKNIEDSGKRSSSTFKVKCNLNCPVFSMYSESSGNMRRHVKVNIVLVDNIFM